MIAAARTILARDLLDVWPRKIYYFPRSGKVLVKRLRKVNNDTIVLRERDYVEAARVMGGGNLTVLVRHVLPHLLPVVGAYAALSVGWAVLFESALGFLGAGVQEPAASIGSMLGAHLIYFRSDPALIAIPALFLGALVIAANLVGESLRAQTEER